MDRRARGAGRAARPGQRATGAPRRDRRPARAAQLHLRGNRLAALPERSGLHALRSLDLRETAITALPDWLAELPALQRLDLRWNGFLDPPPVVERLRERGCVVWL